MKREHERERNTLTDDEGSIGWLAVSGWVPKLKSFGGIRERDVENSTGVRAVVGAGWAGRGVYVGRGEERCGMGWVAFLAAILNAYIDCLAAGLCSAIRRGDSCVT